MAARRMQKRRFLFLKGLQIEARSRGPWPDICPSWACGTYPGLKEMQAKAELLDKGHEMRALHSSVASMLRKLFGIKEAPIRHVTFVRDTLASLPVQMLEGSTGSRRCNGRSSVNSNLVSGHGTMRTLRSLVARILRNRLGAKEPPIMSLEGPFAGHLELHVRSQVSFGIRGGLCGTCLVFKEIEAKRKRVRGDVIEQAAQKGGCSRVFV